VTRDLTNCRSYLSLILILLIYWIDPSPYFRRYLAPKSHVIFYGIERDFADKYSYQSPKFEFFVTLGSSMKGKIQLIIVQITIIV
jgi:hypothetical protein